MQWTRDRGRLSPPRPEKLRKGVERSQDAIEANDISLLFPFPFAGMAKLQEPAVAKSLKFNIFTNRKGRTEPNHPSLQPNKHTSVRENEALHILMMCGEAHLHLLVKIDVD